MAAQETARTAPKALPAQLNFVDAVARQRTVPLLEKSGTGKVGANSRRYQCAELMDAVVKAR